MKINRQLMIVLAIVFALTFGTGILIGKNIVFNESIEEKASKGKAINILLMGIDSRAKDANSRSDTMILVSIDRNTNKIAMVWIPRDTRVEVGFNRYDKINSINYLKGPEAACDAVGKLLDTKVNYYAVVNFAGFAKIVDLLGGVHIDVDINMRHYDPDPKLSINLTKGPQLLNGEDALRYVRYRGGPTADIGRTQRQQKFVKAIAKEMLEPKNILKMPKLIPEVFEHVNTNIPTKDILFMVNLAKEFDADAVITQTLPGYPFTDPRTGASYWEADKKIAKGIIDDLLAGKTYDVAQDPPNWVKPAPAIYEPPAEDEEIEVLEEETEEVLEEDSNLDGEEGMESLGEELANEPELENEPEPSLPTEETGVTEEANLPSQETSDNDEISQT